MFKFRLQNHTALALVIMKILTILFYTYISEVQIYIYTESEIIKLASQFATQNCLGYESKLNLASKFYAVVTHFSHIKLRTL